MVKSKSNFNFITEFLIVMDFFVNLRQGCKFASEWWSPLTKAGLCRVNFYQIIAESGLCCTYQVTACICKVLKLLGGTWAYIWVKFKSLFSTESEQSKLE